MALRTPHLKRRLAYSTVSNLSYILFSVTLMTPAGLVGGLSHMVFHAVIKITLFFCAGAIIYKTQMCIRDRVNGDAAEQPLLPAEPPKPQKNKGAKGKKQKAQPTRKEWMGLSRFEHFYRVCAVVIGVAIVSVLMVLSLIHI